MDNDNLDKFLTWGATPDWISPLLGMIQDFTNGPYYRFYVDRLAGYSVNDLTGLLKQNGIKVWSEMIADGMIIFTVRQVQAQWADHVLRQAGVPLLNQTPPPPGRKNKGTVRERDFLKDFWDWLNN